MGTVVLLRPWGKRLGKTLGAFRSRWFKQIGLREWNQFKPLPDAQDEIEAACSDICISMKTVDHIELPERVDNLIRITLPPKLMRDYKSLEEELFVEISGTEVEVFYQAAATAKCLQFANGGVYHEDDVGEKTWVNVHDLKLDALDSVIEEANGAPVLVAYWYNFDLEKLTKRFPEGVVLADDDTAVQRWNAGEIPVMFLHPASGGHGLNLQDGGNILVWYGPIPSWDLELHQQTNARLHRQGQKQTVFIHTIVADDTLDLDVVARLEGKAMTQDRLMERMRRWRASR